MSGLGVPDNSCLLLLCALPKERSALADALGLTRFEPGGTLSYPAFTGTHTGPKLVLVETGPGLANTAAAAALYLERLRPAGVVSAGIGGAVDPTLRTGEIVVAAEILQHDSLYSLDDRSIPVIPGSLGEPSGLGRAGVVMTDKALCSLLVQPLEKWGLRFCAGLILSGSEFAAGRNRKSALREKYPEALLVEMEAAGALTVCQRAGIPFTAVKAIADTADGTSLSSHFRHEAGRAIAALGQFAAAAFNPPV